MERCEDGRFHGIGRRQTRRQDRLEVRAVDPARQTLDEFTITKSPDVPRPEFRYLRGDANASGGVGISDAITILGYLFLGELEPFACLPAADSNGSGRFDIGDAVFLLSYLFLGGSPPPAPFPDCGPGTDDSFCLRVDC